MTDLRAPTMPSYDAAGSFVFSPGTAVSGSSVHDASSILRFPAALASVSSIVLLGTLALTQPAQGAKTIEESYREVTAPTAAHAVGALADKRASDAALARELAALHDRLLSSSVPFPAEERAILHAHFWDLL